MGTSVERRRAEQTLLRPTLLGLLRLRWLNQMSRADVEIPWHQKRVDLAFLSPRDAVGPVAIELKVDSTARAIEQAALNRFLTPASWVATWTPANERTRNTAQREGVGMLLVTDRGVYPVLYPRRGEARTTALHSHLISSGRRVRDLLSELRHG